MIWNHYIHTFSRNEWSIYICAVSERLPLRAEEGSINILYIFV
jgi:hypothetical protein